MSRFKKQDEYEAPGMEGQHGDSPLTHPIWGPSGEVPHGPGYGAYTRSGEQYHAQPDSPPAYANGGATGAGAPPRKRHRLRWIVLGGVAALVTAVGVGVGASGGSDTAPVAPSSPPSAAPLVPGKVAPGTPAVPALSKKQTQAYRSAQNYLDYSGFSRVGLIHQLVAFDKYTTSDATVAVGWLHVNWNEQAKRVGQAYLDFQGFSHKGLVNQLIRFDKFTPTQAEYAANKLGL
jgi:hypothetical protein